MATIVWGVVGEGRVVPSSPLPEGAHVEIRLTDSSFDVPEDLRAEFEAWDRAGADALELVERLSERSDDAFSGVDVPIRAGDAVTVREVIKRLRLTAGIRIAAVESSSVQTPDQTGSCDRCGASVDGFGPENPQNHLPKAGLAP